MHTGKCAHVRPFACTVPFQARKQPLALLYKVGCRMGAMVVESGYSSDLLGSISASDVVFDIQ